MQAITCVEFIEQEFDWQSEKGVDDALGKRFFLRTFFLGFPESCKLHDDSESPVFDKLSSNTLVMILNFQFFKRIRQYI